MIRCGIVEENEAMLARFMGGLNRDIQTILEYKEYNNITRLFHLACKAKREVQDQQALVRTNFSVGRYSSWTPRASSTSTPPAPPLGATSSREKAGTTTTICQEHTCRTCAKLFFFHGINREQK